MMNPALPKIRVLLKLVMDGEIIDKKGRAG